MTELSKILEIAGHNKKFKDSRKALEAAGAIIHPTDAELANETFTPLEQHGVQQTGNEVLPNLTSNPSLDSAIQPPEVIGQQPISTEEASGWNRVFKMFKLQQKERVKNAA